MLFDIAPPTDRVLSTTPTRIESAIRLNRDDRFCASDGSRTYVECVYMLHIFVPRHLVARVALLSFACYLDALEATTPVIFEAVNQRVIAFASFFVGLFVLRHLAHASRSCPSRAILMLWRHRYR